MEVVALPSCWTVTLRDGGELEVWASSWSVRQGFHLFDTLSRVSAEEEKDLEVVSRAPSDPALVLVVAAKIPESLVLEVYSKMGDGGNS
jgi:hypothetical protein